MGVPDDGSLMGLTVLLFIWGCVNVSCAAFVFWRCLFACDDKYSQVLVENRKSPVSVTRKIAILYISMHSFRMNTAAKTASRLTFELARLPFQKRGSLELICPGVINVYIFGK